MYIYPYKAGSKSANTLKTAMGALMIRLEGSKFKGAEDKIVINWGSSVIMNPEVLKCKVINHPDAVALATDKLKFFNAVAGVVQVPEWTTDWPTAVSWFKRGKPVVARTILNGHSGAGIVYVDDISAMEKVVNAPLFTKYVPKKDEYRVHVAFGEVVDVQRKAKSNDYDVANWKIRSHSNGFVFVREGVDPDEQVLEQALLAVKTIGLDFGAVDVIWNNFYKKAYVLEVNTSPGLEGSTVENYIKAFDQALENKQPLGPALWQPLGVPYPVADAAEFYEEVLEEDEDEDDF